MIFFNPILSMSSTSQPAMTASQHTGNSVRRREPSSSPRQWKPGVAGRPAHCLPVEWPVPSPGMSTEYQSAGKNHETQWREISVPGRKPWLSSMWVLCCGCGISLCRVADSGGPASPLRPQTCYPSVLPTAGWWLSRQCALVSSFVKWRSK